MQTPLQITYRHTSSSEALNSVIEEQARLLERYHPQITHCRVLVDAPARHHRRGKGATFQIRVEATVPGDVFVAERDPAQSLNGADAFAAVHDAFHAMRRQLEDSLRRHREARPVA